MCGPASAGPGGRQPDFRHFSGRGWAAVGVLELTDLPRLERSRWVPWHPGGRRASSSTAATRRTGATWMRESGLADLTAFAAHMSGSEWEAWSDARSGELRQSSAVRGDGPYLGGRRFSILPHWKPSRGNARLTQSGGPPPSASRLRHRRYPTATRSKTAPSSVVSDVCAMDEVRVVTPGICEVGVHRWDVTRDEGVVARHPDLNGARAERPHLAATRGYRSRARG